jgi:hypothetical protein
MEPLSTDICADKLDRRTGRDRRQRRWPTLKSLFANRRRRSVRRKMDRRRLVILDYYHPPLMISILLILVLSIADAVLTLFLLDHGAVELNPVMAYFIQLGKGMFILAKYLFTAASVLIVVLLNYILIRHLNIFTRNLLHFFAGAFALVIAWELFLTFRFVY